jgi:hypothetical protein
MSTHNSIHPCVALILGIGMGLFTSVGAQKLLNSHYQATCHQRPEHNLIYIRGFLGDSYYCVKGAEYKAN